MSTPQFVERQIKDGEINNNHISPGANIAYSKLDLTGKIQGSDLSSGSPVTEGDIQLNYPTHPENSTLSLEQNFLILFALLSAISFTTQVSAVPLSGSSGTSTSAGPVVDETNNLCQIVGIDGVYPTIQSRRIYGRLTSKVIASQPINITGVTVRYCSSNNTPGDLEFDQTLSQLSWSGGSPVSVSLTGLYKLFSSLGDYLIVEVDSGLLPVLDSLDSLTFLSNYATGLFYSDGAGNEFPTTLMGNYHVYYPESKSLHTKPWNFLKTLVDFSIAEDVVAHEHPLSEISDLSVTATELNLLSGLTVSATELNLLSGLTANASEINQALDGIGLSVTSENLDILTDGSNADSLHSHSNTFSAPNIMKFVALASQTIFDIGVVPSFTLVTIQGILQTAPEHYSVSGTQVVLADPAESGERIVVHYWT